MGHAVKDGRRRKIAIKHARKKVTREQQVMFYAVISTMPFCVPQKVYDSQAAPEGKTLFFFNIDIDIGSFVSNEKSPARFKPSAHPIDPLIGISPVQMCLLVYVPVDGCTCQLFKQV